MELKRGIDLAVDGSDGVIDKIKKDVEGKDIAQVGDDLGQQRRGDRRR